MKKMMDRILIRIQTLISEIDKHVFDDKNDEPEFES